MKSEERWQLRDEIISGKMCMSELSLQQLRDMSEDFGDGYEPKWPFFQSVQNEIRERKSKPTVHASINRNFFR